MQACAAFWAAVSWPAHPQKVLWIGCRGAGRSLPVGSMLASTTERAAGNFEPSCRTNGLKKRVIRTGAGDHRQIDERLSGL